MNPELKEYLDAWDARRQREFEHLMARLDAPLRSATRLRPANHDTPGRVVRPVQASSGTSELVAASAGLTEPPAPAPSIVASPGVAPAVHNDTISVVPATCSAESVAEAATTTTLLLRASGSSPSPASPVVAPTAPRDIITAVPMPCSTFCSGRQPRAAPWLVTLNPNRFITSRVLVHRPMRWPSFMDVHADGDETRPLPWPSFREITSCDCESPREFQRWSAYILQFMWQLTLASLHNSNHHLAHIPLKETHLSDCSGFCVDMDARFELEDRNLGSDFFVVKGVGIGHEAVSAQLFEPWFEHVNDTVTLTVAEAMSLEPPSPVLVTLGVSVNFKLKIFREKVAQVVNLPSQYHLWHVTNSSVAQVDSSLGVVHASGLGFTNVVVEDARVSGHQQVSSLHVVSPRTLFLYLVPVMDDSDHLLGITNIPSSEVWYVFPGKKYMVLAKAFAEGFDTREIFITEENNFRLESSTLKIWNLSWVPDNYVVQTSRLLSPICQGNGHLVASLSYQAEASGSAKVLKLLQEVNVYTKVKATWDEGTENSNIIHLPWVPGVYQEVELMAVGGCGKTMEDYKLYSSDESVVSVSDSRTVRAKKPGQAVIKVVSLFDFLNFDEVIIEVSTPSTLAILPIFPVEVAVGTQLHTAVTFKTSNGHSYSRCDYFSAFIRWSLLSENQTFEVVDTAEALSIEALKHHAGSWTQHGNPCAWIYLNASAAGRATIVATFSSESEPYLETFNVPIFLKATSKVSALFFWAPTDLDREANHHWNIPWDPGGYMFALCISQNWWITPELNHLHSLEELQWFCARASRIWLVAWDVDDLEFSTGCGQTLSQGGRNVTNPGIFFDQFHDDHDYYLTSVHQITVNYDFYLNEDQYLDPNYNNLKYYCGDYHEDSNKIKEVHVPWDPGKATFQYHSKSFGLGSSRVSRREGC